MADKKELPVKAFKNSEQFRVWLMKSHAKADGVWLRFFKKASKKETLTHKEAIEEALCFGWIDGQARPYDENSWLQKFTPRRARSIWSKRNTKIVAELIKSKRIQPAGLAEVKKAKEDGRWQKAYESPKDMKIPKDFLTLVKKNKKAYEFFKTLNKTNLYSIAWRLHTAKKPETRTRRMSVIVQMLAENKKFHG
jgi:uncharacterized protein YdeI (YjbR/CyaY-like superfamily)